MSNLGSDCHDNKFRPNNLKRKFVSKAWGWEDWIVNKEEYCGKLLFIKKGLHTSWHFHKIKDEVLYLDKGKLKFSYGVKDDYLERRENVLLPGDSFHVPVGLRHRLIAVEDSYVFEFSTQHFDEDSHRIDISDNDKGGEHE